MVLADVGQPHAFINYLELLTDFVSRTPAEKQAMPVEIIASVHSDGEMIF